jgi:AraC-like DNA-binding protein
MYSMTEEHQFLTKSHVSSLVGRGKDDPLSCTVLFNQYGPQPEGHCTPQHTHPFWQCELLTEGACTVHYQRRQFTLPAGRLLLIPPGQEHGFRYRASTVISVKFETPLRGGGLVSDDAVTRSLAQAMTTIVADVTCVEKERHRMLSGLMAAILVHHHREASEPGQDDLLALVDFNCDHLGDRNVRLDELAERIGCSSGHLANRWRQEVGGSIKAHIDQRRARRAVHLLRYSDAGIPEIADLLAFSEPSALSRFCKRLTGKSPKELRHQSRQLR